MAELDQSLRLVLRALCDTFVPSIKVADDPTGFWARTASDVGVDRVIESVIGNAPPELRQELINLLDVLATQSFVGASQQARESILAQIASNSPQARSQYHTFVGFLPAAARDIFFLEKQTLLLNYALPATAEPNENLITYGVPRGQNPNWEVMGYPGPVSVPPKRPEEPIQPWVPPGDSVTLDADVCVVGSG